jgi:hypothetical protein
MGGEVRSEEKQAGEEQATQGIRNALLPWEAACVCLHVCMRACVRACVRVRAHHCRLNERSACQFRSKATWRAGGVGVPSDEGVVCPPGVRAASGRSSHHGNDCNGHPADHQLAMPPGRTLCSRQAITLINRHHQHPATSTTTDMQRHRKNKHATMTAAAAAAAARRHVTWKTLRGAPDSREKKFGLAAPLAPLGAPRPSRALPAPELPPEFAPATDGSTEGGVASGAGGHTSVRKPDPPPPKRSGDGQGERRSEAGVSTSMGGRLILSMFAASPGPGTGCAKAPTRGELCVAAVSRSATACVRSCENARQERGQQPTATH